MKNNGPYVLGDKFDLGDMCHRFLETESEVQAVNIAFHTGRKQMENMFSELLGIAKDLYIGSDNYTARCVFESWKKARGIE